MEETSAVERAKEPASKWGNPFSRVISGECTIETTEEFEVQPTRIFGRTFGKAHTASRTVQRTLSVKKGDTLPEEVETSRMYLHRCGLLSAYNLLGHKSSRMVMHFDGFHSVDLDAERVSIGIEPKLMNGEQDPVADICFDSYGTQYQCTCTYRIRSVRLLFAERTQLRDYIVALPMDAPPQQPVHRTVVHEEGGGSFLIPLILGVALGAALD